MPLPGSVEKLERSLFRDEAYATLREWIVDGTLRPGEQMRDQELAKLLGVSRAPIRDALQRLEAEGLVQTAANRWTRVTPVDVADARAVYPILRSLEPLAIELAATPLAPEELAALEAANARVQAAIRDELPALAEIADRDFHQFLIARSGNPDLIRIVAELRIKLRRVGITYFDGNLIAARSVDEHAAIIAALRDNAPARAMRASARHWHGSYHRFLDRSSAVGRGL